MLTIDNQGKVRHPRVVLALRSNIERGDMAKVRGIIVHQTGGSTSASTLNSYRALKANGAHFLIDKDGTIFQTASLHKQTWHVGALRARCVAEYRCTGGESRIYARFNPKAEHRAEIKKAVPARYPSNKDSIGIELVGALVGPGPAESASYETVTTAQNNSLQWLVRELRTALGIPLTEVFRHPVVSRKNPTEAASASW